VVEVHAEEEQVRGVNLDGGRAGGVDLNGGCTVEAHVEEELGVHMAWTLTAGARWRCTWRSEAPTWR
jgi:hypothetical protein